jgi:uncharacterized membrane protein
MSLYRLFWLVVLLVNLAVMVLSSCVTVDNPSNVAALLCYVVSILAGGWAFVRVVVGREEKRDHETA